MRTIKKEIGLEELVSRIPSLFPYIDFDIYGDSVLYKGSEEQDVVINSGELGVLRKATYGIEGSYGHVMGSFRMPEGVYLYSDPVMYYPSLYSEINGTDEIDIFRYNELSLYGRNCYNVIVYRYYGIEDGKVEYINSDTYGDIDDKTCEKYDYRPYLYYNNKVSETNVDVTEYSALPNVSNVWFADGNGWYKDGDDNYHELITVESYRNKSIQSKIDFKVCECSNGEDNIKLSELPGDYEVKYFITRRSDNTFVDDDSSDSDFDVTEYIDEVIYHDFYGLSLRELLIKPGETYSYRMMMDIYYANRDRKVKSNYNPMIINAIKENGEWKNIVDTQRFVNKEKKTDVISFVDYTNLMNETQPFIKFIDDAIGKCYIDECVKEYNESEHEPTQLTKRYYLNDVSQLDYDVIHDSAFANIDKIFECVQYVKVTEESSNYPVYLYVNKYNGGTITPASYEELSRYGSSSYTPNEYDLINDASAGTRISSDVYNQLSFYGKASYSPYQYARHDMFISSAEYNELDEDDKSIYTPYTYINKNNSADIITKNVYDTAYKKNMRNSNYIVYQYANVNYTIISNNDFINIYDSDTDKWGVYSYVNTTKSNDIISVVEYDKLPEHGSLDYTSASFVNIDDSSDIIDNLEDFYNLDSDGQNDYDALYYVLGSEINANVWKNKKDKDQYRPYKYEPREFVVDIDEFQYNALPKYGAKDYVVNEYYARIDISADGEQPTYETYIITAQQYNDWDDESIVGEKYQYSIYSYKPDDDKLKPGDSADDYVVLFEDYENVPYFGQVDYVMNDNGNGEDIAINLRREIYIHRRTGAIISEREYGVLSDEQKDNYESAEESGKCTISLVPEVIYLAQVNGMLYQMRNMKRNHELLISKKLPLETDVNCEYSKYLRMGGEDMIKLLEWLLVKADEKADELLNYGILDNYITMPLTLNLTLQDIGYYTPAMNYKTIGDTIEPGERFTYVDENGVAETYLNNSNVSEVFNGVSTNNILKLRDEINEGSIVGNREIQLIGDREIQLSGTIDSQLKTLRMPITYSNYMDQPETPKDGEDWLFYYRKGGVYDATSITDENGDIAQIVDVDATGSDLYIYGNILSDIKADNTTCTIEFTYYLNAHLKLVGAGKKHTYECYVTKEEYEERYENKQSKFWVNKNVTDKSVKISATNPDRQNYDNLFSSEIDEYCQWDEETGDYVCTTQQPQQGQEDEYPYRHIIITYYDKVFELDKDKDSAYGKHHGVKHVDTYHYEQYGELYDLVENGGFENYINSTNRGIEKYAFKATPTNSMRKIVNNIEITIPYISSEFEFKFDQLENSNNDLYNNIYKEDLLNGIHYKPIISNEAFIVRGTNAAFERHLRLGEIKSLEDFENYHNGSFFNIQNNF